MVLGLDVFEDVASVLVISSRAFLRAVIAHHCWPPVSRLPNSRFCYIVKPAQHKWMTTGEHQVRNTLELKALQWNNGSQLSATTCQAGPPPVQCALRKPCLRTLGEQAA